MTGSRKCPFYLEIITRPISWPSNRLRDTNFHPQFLLFSPLYFIKKKKATHYASLYSKGGCRFIYLGVRCFGGRVGLPNCEFMWLGGSTLTKVAPYEMTISEVLS